MVRAVGRHRTRTDTTRVAAVVQRYSEVGGKYNVRNAGGCCMYMYSRAFAWLHVGGHELMAVEWEGMVGWGALPHSL